MSEGKAREFFYIYSDIGKEWIIENRKYETIEDAVSAKMRSFEKKGWKPVKFHLIEKTAYILLQIENEDLKHEILELKEERGTLRRDLRKAECLRRKLYGKDLEAGE